MSLRKLLAAIFSLLSLSTYSQWNEKSHIDSIAHCVCKELHVNSDKLDSNRLIYAFIRCSALYNQKDQEQDNKAVITEKIVSRLLKNCVVFDDYFETAYPQQKRWNVLKEPPASKASMQDCKSFSRIKNFSYIDPAWSTKVKVRIDKHLWVDHFKDGSYSKLSLQWLNDWTFRITFIESNNASRNKMSIPGDSYDYQIIEKTDHYFLLSVNITGIKRFSTFKMFY